MPMRALRWSSEGRAGVGVRALAQLLLASSLLGAPRAAAQPSRPEPAPLRLEWATDDPSCHGADVAERAVALVTPGVRPRPLTAHVQVAHEEGGWSVQLQTESPGSSGRRTLRAESCENLRQAIALLLAMAMEAKDIQQAAPAPAAPPAPPATSAPPAEPPAPAPARARSSALPRPPPAVPSERAGLRLGGFVRAGGRAGLGQQPGLALGATLAAGARLGPLELGARATHWPATVASAAGRTARLALGRDDIGLRACWSFRLADGLTAAPCLAPELTFFRHESERLATPSSGTSGPFPSLSAALDLRRDLLGDVLGVVLSAGLTWEKPQPFHIALLPAGEMGAGGQAVDMEIYRTKGLGARLEVGVDARF